MCYNLKKGEHIMITQASETTPTPNEKQLKCINNTKGKFLILAGPGTGKTFTLTKRIELLIKDEKVEPEKILCLTFSDAAANEMRKRVEANIDANLGQIGIYTFHAFCNEIISENAQDFELTENYKKIPDTVKREFLKECIDEYDAVIYRNNKNNPYVYIETISNSIKEIKKYRLDEKKYFKNLETNPDYMPKIKLLEAKKAELTNDEKNAKKIETFSKEIEEVKHSIEAAKEIWAYYDLYKAKMEKAEYIDFEDMINFILDKFETDPIFLDKIANKYEYIMVDEYQDTNKSQNEIVFALTHALKTQNICVVGDDDQIVYAFQGASMDTLEGYLKEFPDTEVICLTENMRSTQSVLDVAQEIIKNDSTRLEANETFKTKYKIDKSPHAKNEKIIAKDKKVQLTIFDDPAQEVFNVVQDIEKLLSSNDFPTNKNGEKKFSEIAIIVTGHALAEEYEKVLNLKNIPTQRAKTKSIFEIKSSITLFYYLQLLCNPKAYEDKILKLLLMKPFEIHPADFTKILLEMAKNKTLFETMREFHDWVNPSKIESFVRIFDELTEYKTKENSFNTVLEVGAKTGIFNEYINSEINKNENISALQKIISEAKDFSDIYKEPCLEEFVDYLLMAQNENDVDINIDKSPVTLNAVQILTYQGSKGMEFDYVYLPSLQASKWESSSQPSLKPLVPVSQEDYKDEDERRVLRRADRAKNLFVGMTRARHTLKLSYVNKRPCSWIENISDMLEVVKDTDFDIKKYMEIQVASIQKTPYDYKRDAVIKDKDYKYSASSMNRYLKCPRMYMYGDILSLNTRGDIPDNANYGTAFHETCRWVFETAKKSAYPTKEETLQKFKEIMDTLPFTTLSQRKIFEGRGINELNNYYHHLTDIPIKKIYGVEVKIEDPEDAFVGSIDRIEENEDGTYTIIDYKTSDPKKCEKEICPGKTHEDYYNQICLYKYYFEKLENKKVSKMAFYFPLTNTSIDVCPTEEEFKDAIQNYKNMRKEISEHNFEPTKKDYPCGYCAFSDFCSFNRI